MHTGMISVFCIITFVHPVWKRRVYVQLRGLPFGLGAVVNQFNRLPNLFTAVQRRVLCIVAGHYFDDNIHMDLSQWAATTKVQVNRLATIFRVVFFPKKRRPMSCLVDFLGHSFDRTSIEQEVSVTLTIKQSTAEKALDLQR